MSVIINCHPSVYEVLQRREDGSVDFYLYWDDYKRGFGDLNGEFWLGNDYIHQLTRSREYELRVDLEDFDGNTAYAKYSTFSIGDEMNKYKLNLGSYSGDAGDFIFYIGVCVCVCVLTSILRF